MNKLFKNGLVSLAAASVLATGAMAAGSSVPVLKTDRLKYNIHQIMGIQVIDEDSNESMNSSPANTVSVTITNSSGDSVTKYLKQNAINNSKIFGYYEGTFNSPMVEQNGTTFTDDNTESSDASGDDKNATLYVSIPDTITVSFSSPKDGDSVSKTITIDYDDASFDGTTTKVYAKTAANQDKNVTVILRDNDLNMYVEKNDTKIIKVFNSSGVSAKMILDETGPNTGIFKGILHVATDTTKFDSNATSASVSGEFDRNTTIGVLSTGDTLTLHYGTGVNAGTYDSISNSDTNVSGYTMDIRSGGIQEDVTFTIDVSAGTKGTISLSSTEITSGQPITITLTDSDLDTSSSSIQTVNAGSQPGSSTPGSGQVMLYITDQNGNYDYNITVPLTETGLNTGVFTKTVRFYAKKDVTSDNVAEANTTVIPVEALSTITVKYNDALDGDSDSANNVVKATATFKAHTGTIAANRTVVNDKGQVKLTLTDPDLNKNADAIDVFESNESDSNVTVCVGTYTTSDGVYCIGNNTQSLTFTETGVNTGIFVSEAFDVNVTGNGTPETSNRTAPYDLNATASSNRVITVTYFDAETEDGSEFNNSNRASAPKTIISATTATGSLQLDKSSYSIGETINITVTDADLNKDPEKVDTYDTTTSLVYAKSTTNGISDITDSSYSDITIKLTETGVNTGVFTGSVTLSNSTSSSSQTINTSAGKIVVIYYNQNDDNDYTDDSGDVYTQALVVSNSGTISVDKTSVNTYGDMVTITVTDPDLNINANVKDSANVVKVVSTTDSTGITLTLTETEANSGVFTGTFTTTTNASSGTNLQVTNGDTIVATYTDAKDAAGNSNVKVNATLTTSETLATLEVPSSVEEGASFKISLTEPDGNINNGTNAYAPDSITVKVFSTSDPIGQDLTLVETGADTKVFEGTLSVGSNTITGSSIKAVDGDTITVRYTDASDNNPNTTQAVGTKVTKTISVVSTAPLATENTSVTAEKGKTTTVTFTGANGDLTVTSSDESVATATVDGSVVTINAVEVGEATISVTDGVDTVEVTVTITEPVAEEPAATDLKTETENTLAGQTFDIAGYFGGYDFDGNDKVDAYNDWAYTNYAGTYVFQLLGYPSGQGYGDTPFGWKQADIASSDVAHNFVAVNYGSGAFDWVMITPDCSAVYKLVGATSDGKFNYDINEDGSVTTDDALNLTCTISEDKVTFESK